MIIHAAETFDPTLPVQEVGLKTGNRVVSALEATGSDGVVTVSFRGVRGAGSSYFNVLLHRIVDWTGLDQFERRVNFEFDLPSQKFVFDQSLRAIRKSRARAS
jgi:hypothetical protein